MLLLVGGGVCGVGVGGVGGVGGGVHPPPLAINPLQLHAATTLLYVQPETPRQLFTLLPINLHEHLAF